MKANKKLKILFVAMSDSIHTVRWISQVADQGWELHLFSSHNWVLPYPGFKNITLHQFFHHRKIKDYKKQNPSVKFAGPNIFSKLITIYLIFCKKFASEVFKTQIKFLQKRGFADYQAKHLCHLIEELRPDIVHSMEFQAAGYLTLGAKKRYKGIFPKWIATNWGSDIYLFGRLKKHQSKIREILEQCDFYSCECHRDVYLAKNNGLDVSKVLPVFPNTGGFNLSKVKKSRQQGKTSLRKLIMLKGYQNWAGRALVGLRALERCADLLKKYKIVIYSTYPGSEVEVAAELFTEQTGIPTEIVPLESSHETILKLHGQARISIGLSVSDAISTSLLEAIVMGSFPIQSNTACANEWIKDGKTGILVPPDDPDVIEKAIRKALTNDKLVNQASQINWQVAQKKLEETFLEEKTIDFYRKVCKNLKKNV